MMAVLALAAQLSGQPKLTLNNKVIACLSVAGRLRERETLSSKESLGVPAKQLEAQ